jgi:acyl-CoA synthetase (NDP forming)
VGNGPRIHDIRHGGCRLTDVAPAEPTVFRSVEPLLRPRSIAIVGASASGGWSQAIYENIRATNAEIAVYPVNPRRDVVWGQRCFPSFASLPERIDLALIITPAATIAETLREGVAHGLRAATIYASGFGEGGGDAEGAARAAELADLAASGLRLCGPNCMGTLSVAERLYLYPTARVRGVEAGSAGLVMQSGGLFQYWLQYAAARGIGISYAISSGNELDLDLADYINFLVDDERTTVICALAEGIRRPAAFLAAAARALDKRKPIVMMKIGRSAGAQAAAQSHTGSLAGDDRVFDAACERYGIVRVPALDDLIECALAFRSGRLPARSGTMFVGYSGSARGMLLDAVDGAGLELAELTAGTRAALAPLVDPVAVLENPIDLGANTTRDLAAFGRIAELVAADPNVGLLVVQAQLPLDGERADAAWVRGIVSATTKPVFAYARTGQNVVEAGRAYQTASGMPFLQSIPRSIRAAVALIAYGERTRRPVPSAPPPRTPHATAARAPADDLIAQAGIAVPAQSFAASVDAAVAAAERIGFPVALKLHSAMPLHKTEAGGVVLGLADGAAVAAAAATLFRTIAARPELGCDGVLVQEMVAGVELIVGLRSDPQYGPIVLLGLGGIFVEVLDDLAVRLLPVTPADVYAMLDGLRGRRILAAFRGRPACDLAAVVNGVVALGDAFLAARSHIDDLEINPLMVLAQGRGVRAVDVRVVARAQPA